MLLYGLSYSWSDVALSLAKSSDKDSLTVGGFLYATLASLALGLIVSAARWLIVDTALKWMGVRNPSLKYEKLKDRDTLAAFSAVVTNHYRYYQYYAKTLIALSGAFPVYLANHNGHVSCKFFRYGDCVIFGLAGCAEEVFYAGSKGPRMTQKAGDRPDERLGL